MINLELFLGFCPDKEFEAVQKKMNPHLVSLLTSGGVYLESLSFQNRQILGKKAAFPLSLEELKLLETNILSLLKKLAPAYSFSLNPLTLHTLTKETLEIC